MTVGWAAEGAGCCTALSLPPTAPPHTTHRCLQVTAGFQSVLKSQGITPVELGVLDASSICIAGTTPPSPSGAFSVATTAAAAVAAVAGALAVLL